MDRALGASMTAPQWAAVDEQTGSLLDLLADDYEWEVYVDCLRMSAGSGAGNTIDPNWLRIMVRGQGIKPQRVGAFTHRALAQGLVEYTGEYVTSTDTKGRNGGKPCRELRWIGGAA